MTTLILSALVIATGERIDLDDITVNRARALDGRRVVAVFRIAKPTYTLLGRTVIGAADRDDGAERTAVLWGKRLDLDVGQRVAVAGVLRVIDHRPDVIGGVFVGGGSR
jgi:hypothetical protein